MPSLQKDPSQQIRRFATRKESPLGVETSSLFFTLDEFVKTFAEPYHVEVDSEEWL